MNNNIRINRKDFLLASAIVLSATAFGINNNGSIAAPGLKLDTSFNNTKNVLKTVFSINQEIII